MALRLEGKWMQNAAHWLKAKADCGRRSGASRRFRRRNSRLKNSDSYQGIVLEAAEEVLALAKRDPLQRGSIFSDLAALVEEVAEKVDMLTSAP